MKFDIEAARRDGIPDALIAEHLAGESGFDLVAARRDGLPDRLIAEHLAGESTPRRNAFALANDTVIEAGNAAAGLVKAGVDLFAPGSAPSQAIDGFIKDGQSKQSDWKQAERQQLATELQAAEGELDKAGIYARHALVEDPLGTAGQALGNLGPFAAAGRVVKSAAGMMGLAGGLSAGEVRGNIAEKISNTPDAILVEQSPEYAAFRQQGLSEADAKQAVGADLWRNLPEVAAAGAVGALGGKFGAEGMLAGVAPKMGGRLVSGAIGVADEATQGAVEQLASNAGVMRVLPGQRLMEDVALNATAEGILGAGAAARPSAVHGGGSQLAPTQASALDDPTQIMDAIGQASDVSTAIDTAMSLSQAPIATPVASAPAPEQSVLQLEADAFDLANRVASIDVSRNPSGTATVRGPGAEEVVAAIAPGIPAITRRDGSVLVGRQHAEQLAAIIRSLQPQEQPVIEPAAVPAQPAVDPVATVPARPEQAAPVIDSPTIETPTPAAVMPPAEAPAMDGLSINQLPSGELLVAGADAAQRIQNAAPQAAILTRRDGSVLVSRRDAEAVTLALSAAPAVPEVPATVPASLEAAGPASKALDVAQPAGPVEAMPSATPNPLDSPDSLQVPAENNHALPNTIRNALHRARPDTPRRLRAAPRSAPVLAAPQAADVPGNLNVKTRLATVGERELPVESVRSWDDAARVFGQLSKHAVERVDGLVTDAEGHPLAVVGGFKGAPTQSSVYPSTLIGEISGLEGAAHLWLAHNHPSGTERLSEADRRLSETIAKTLAGSGIEYHGLAAVGRTGNRIAWQATDDSGGEVPHDPPTRQRVPVMDREIVESNPGETVSSPATAKRLVTEIAKDQPGIVFLTAQNAVAGFVPFDPTEMGELRRDGRLMRLFRAVSQSGAVGALVAMPDGKVTPAQFANLKGALSAVDVRVLDGIRYDAATGDATSLAEKGLDDSAGSDFKNRANPQAGMSAMDSAIYASARAGDSLKGVLEGIAEASGTPFYRQLAELLLEKRIDAMLQTAPADGVHGGTYDPKSNTISLLAEADAERHLLHEAVHAATLAGLASNRPAADAMQALLEHAKAHLTGEHYGLTNVEEFVSEVFSNPTLQQALAELPARPGSRLRNAWHWFVRNVRQLLGADSKNERLLAEVLDAGLELMTPLAPNGQPSNLTPTQWQQVRTPEFKAWFGDWENDPANASRVVDENGEPRVVYHGSKRAGDITAFQPNARGLIWASSDRSTAESYAGTGEDVRIGSGRAGMLPVFMNIRQPAEVNLGGKNYAEFSDVAGEAYVDRFAMDARKDGRDGAILRNVIDDGGDSAVGDLTEPADNFVVFRPEQIKSAMENVGRFDPTNPDIRYNRLDEQRQSVADWVKNHLTSNRGWMLGALTRDQLADIYGAENPEVAEFDRVTQAMDQIRNTIAEEADAIIERWRQLPEKEADRLSDVMHQATLMQSDPAIDETSPLRAEWAQLNPEAKQLYEDVRDKYRATLVKLRNGLARRAEYAGTEGQRIGAAIRLEFDKYLEQGPYFPLARFGDFLLIGTKGGERTVESFENATARAKRERRLRAQGWTVKLSAKKDYSAATDGPSGEFVGKVLKLVDGLDMAAQEKSGLMDSLNQLAIASLPDQSARKHFAHRKGTPGFSTDAMRAFASSMQHVAHHTARVLYGDDLQFLLSSLNKRIAESGGDVDMTEQQQVANELTKRLELMLNPNTHPLTAALGQVGFVMSLGGSLASGLVNLSQTPLVTYPWLGAKFGFTKAGAALTQATADYFGGPWEKWSGFVLKDNPKLTGDERRALVELEEGGLINLTQAQDLAGTANTDRAASQRSFAINRAMKVVGWTFHVPEVFNRQVSALAAYRLSRAVGEDHGRAVERARETLRRTHFDYSASNRARWMSGNFVRVISMFKQYSQNMTYLLWRNAYLALQGESPAVKAEASRLLLGVGAMHFAAAGSLGLPLGVFGVSQLLALLAMGMGDDDKPWDWQTEYRNWLADTVGKKAGEAIAHGPMRLLLNVDLASRVGLNDLWVRAPQKEAEGRDLVEAWMLTLLGPVAGYVGNIGTAAKAFDEGKYGRGLEAMLPKMLASPLKAMRYETEGVRSWRGDDLGVKLDQGEIFATAMGFQPARLAEMYEGRAAVKGAEHALKARREELTSMWIAGRLAGDEAGVREAWAQIQRFNRINPTLRVTGDTLSRSLAAKRRNAKQIQEGYYLPKKQRALREEGRFADWGD